MLRVAARKIEEERVPMLQLHRIEERISDDYAGDSDLSDDMLEQDGSIVGISSLAATFQKHDEAKDNATAKKRTAPVYKPRVEIRPVQSVATAADSSSSGGETEVDEPDAEIASADRRSRSNSSIIQPRKAHSAKDLFAMRDDEAPDITASLRRTKSTPAVYGVKEDIEDDLTATSAKRICIGRLSPPRSTGLRLPHELRRESQRAARCDEGSSPVPATRTSSRRSTPSCSRSRSASVTSTSTADMDDTLSFAALAKDSPASTDRTSAKSAPRKAKISPGGRKRKLTQSEDTEREIENVATDSQSTAEVNSETDIRVILTGIELTSAIRKKIRSIGSALYEDDVTKATHVIAPEGTLKRTVKLLCGVSCCAHILDERWLDESARAGQALDEQSYCLHDATAESKWSFDLKKTMYSHTSEQRQQLFRGQTVFITNHKSILPPVKDLVNIVECAGGQVKTKGQADASDLVITSEAALALVSVQKALARADPAKIFTSELILSSILQQHIDLNANRIEQKAPPSSKKKRGR